MDWNEMLDEFRALGGVADNVEIKEGRFGRGLFAVDPKKPVKLFVPGSLMFQISEIQLTEDGLRLNDKANADERTRRFWADYQREFGWGPGRGHAEHLLKLMQEAPPGLRALLDKPFNLDAWLAEPTREGIFMRFLTTRTIHHQDAARIMPVIELANHGPGHGFDIAEGVTLSGLFPQGEVLSRYRVCDPWGIFASSSEEFALSLDMGLETKWGMLRIECGEINNKPGQTPFFPKVEIIGPTIKLSYMLLGHRKFPRLARGVFNKIMRDNGHGPSDELFDHIHHINRTQLYRLLAASEDAAPELGRLVRDAARYQLEAMSWSMGTREL
jgi:hypothetical protein